MLLLIDNHDSFTFNLAQLFAEVGAAVVVVRNDALTAAELVARSPSAVIVGPGPGRPTESGPCAALLAALPATTPVLGVCLGHQALVLHCGGELERDPVPVHGRASEIHHTRTGLLADLPTPFRAGRYHSLCARAPDLPPDLRLTGWTDDGQVMAVEHARRPWFGVQFHPESILSQGGERLAARFAALAAGRAGEGGPRRE